jgi:hypothetical protein
MKSILFLAFAFSFSTAFSQKEMKWVTMFNGKDIRDWTIKIKDHPINENFANTFSVKDGFLTVNYDKYDGFKEQYGHIFYKKKFSAYLLVLEYRFIGEQIKGGAGWALRNSGAMLASPAPEVMQLDQDFPTSLEMQLLAGNGKDPRHTANLCTPGTNVVMDDKLFTPHCIDSKSQTFHGDQWVHVEALVLGDSLIQHIVGADTVLQYSKPQYDGRDPWVKKAALKGGELIKEGYISLQSESHPVQYRKVIIYDLAEYMNDKKKLGEALVRLRNRKLNK